MKQHYREQVEIVVYLTLAGLCFIAGAVILSNCTWIINAIIDRVVMVIQWMR